MNAAARSPSRSRRTAARPSREPQIVSSDRALEEAIRRLGRPLWRAACTIAAQYDADPADLYQEALIRLWELDPSRYLAGELQYLRQAAVRCMIGLGRREDARHRSLPIVARFR